MVVRLNSKETRQYKYGLSQRATAANQVNFENKSAGFVDSKTARERDLKNKAKNSMIKVLVGLLVDLFKIEAIFNSSMTFHQISDLMKDVDLIKSREKMLLMLKGVNGLEIEEK